MRAKYIIYTLTLCATLFASSCQREAPLKPTTFDEPFVNESALENQGTNIYQERLKEYFAKHDCLVLYNFDLQLMQYEVVALRDEYTCLLAEESAVGDLLDFLDEAYFGLLGDEAINNYSPRYVLLGKELKRYETPINCYFGRTAFSFTGADSSFAALSNEQLREYKNNICHGFIERAITRSLIDIPDGFSSLTAYGDKGINKLNYHEYGFVEYGDYIITDYKKDLNALIKVMVSAPQSELEAAGGVLNPSVDVNGIIKSKYNVVKNMLSAASIDIEKISEYGKK